MVIDDMQQPQASNFAYIASCTTAYGTIDDASCVPGDGDGVLFPARVKVERLDRRTPGRWRSSLSERGPVCSAVGGWRADRKARRSASCTLVPPREPTARSVRRRGRESQGPFVLPVNQLLPKVAVVAAFALSCFMLLVFLWSAFGGPIPLRAQGYQVTADFDGANTLGVQAEVRISGVPVGRVVGLKSSPNGLTRATIQLDARYAPLPSDARAILRAKSLAGETYVELSPGTPDRPADPRSRAHPADRNVQQTVQLDRAISGLDAQGPRGVRRLAGRAGAGRDRAQPRHQRLARAARAAGGAGDLARQGARTASRRR